MFIFKGWTALDGHADVYYVALANTNGEQDSSFDYNLDGTLFADTYENATISVSVKFNAIQQANFADQAAAYTALIAQEQSEG